MPAASCASCALPLDPGESSCPRCGAGSEEVVPPSTIAMTPAWASDAEPDPVPLKAEAPPSMRSAGIAFDRAATLSRPAASARGGAMARAKAFAVDAALVALVSAVTLAAGATAFGVADLRAVGHGSALSGAARLLAANPAAAAALALLLLALASAYSIFFVGLSGRTPGMARAGFRVVRDDGRAVGFADAVNRVGGVLLAIAPLCLGLAWPLLDREGRPLCDRLARTRLVTR